MSKSPSRLKTLTLDQATRKNSHCGAGAVRAGGHEGADPRRLCAVQPGSQPVAGVARQGCAGWVGPRGGGAAQYPVEEALAI